VGTLEGIAPLALAVTLVLGVLLWFQVTRLRRAERERQAALDAVSSGQRRLQLIIEGALDAVVTIDRDGLITEWNAHAEFMFGWARGEVLGRQLAQTIVPPQHVDAHVAGLRRYLDTGRSRILNRRIEISALHRSGREIPIEITITPLRGAGGIEFCAFLRDVSDRREAQAALEASERHFRVLAESLPNLVWTCRADGWCDYLSRQWLEYTGSPEEQQLGFGWAEHLHPDDRERVNAAWAAARARGGFFDIEFRIRRHDGVYRWFRTRAAPLRDPRSGNVRWFGSNTDIEEYKQAQQRLGMQIERLHLLDESTRAISERQDLRSIFQAVLGSLESGLTIEFACTCTHDVARQELVVQYIGGASHRLAAVADLAEGDRIDLGPGGLARCLSGVLVHEPALAASPAPFARQLLRAGLHALVLAPVNVDGRVFGMLVAARREAHGFSSGDCEFLRQLSDHVALAARQAELYGNLQAAYEDLRRSQQALVQQERVRVLGQMASGIAHDINNALSPAAMYIQNALENRPDLSEEARSQLKVVERAIESVAQTIGRLRQYYREHELPQADGRVDANAEIRHAVDLTRARWHAMPQQRGAFIDLVTDLAPDLPGTVGTGSELRDAVTNLILNAVDAMPQGGTLTLRSRLRGGVRDDGSDASAVEIAVRDTGVGMDEETRRRCLEPFFTTKGERGTGLGLAMVHGMVERHRLQLEIDSVPEFGTEVRLLLPLSREVAQQPVAVRPEPIPAQRILLVDDDSLVLRSLREILEADGHAVEVAGGGQAGIEALQRMEAEGEPCSLVVTDLGMPHVDGRKVAAAAKSLRQPPPVILLTGWGQRLVEEGDIPPHVDRVLSKPPRLAELRAAFAALVR
jgi:PAS domain S-box-containing protein